MATVSLRDEVTGLLQELLRTNTVNPPGNETRAAELLRDYLKASGVECRLRARLPERANLVARIPGRDPAAPRLLFLSHTDTVLADAAEWAVDPWSGALSDGEVWGRGALDMKGQAAASAVAVATLARGGFRPEGDLVFAATADEEVGQGFGLSWLCEEHPEDVRAAWCLNEGGGDRIRVGGRTLYLCATSEKACAPFVLRVRGRSGHASMPSLGDNALLKAAALLSRLGQLELPVRLMPETSAFLRAIVGEQTDPVAALAGLRTLSPATATMLEPMLRATVVPTQISASARFNIIPALCEIVCDCRLLPGESLEEAERQLHEALELRDEAAEIEWLEYVGGSRSALGTPLWETIEGFLDDAEPGSALVPVLLPGFTDSHYLRERFGTVAYGFFPMRTMDPELAATLVHSADERAAVDDLELGTRFLVQVAGELLG